MWLRSEVQRLVLWKGRRGCPSTVREAHRVLRGTTYCRACWDLYWGGDSDRRGVSLLVIEGINKGWNRWMQPLLYFFSHLYVTWGQKDTGLDAAVAQEEDKGWTATLFLFYCVSFQDSNVWTLGCAGRLDSLSFGAGFCLWSATWRGKDSPLLLLIHICPIYLLLFHSCLSATTKWPFANRLLHPQPSFLHLNPVLPWTILTHIDTLDKPEAPSSVPRHCASETMKHLSPLPILHG